MIHNTATNIGIAVSVMVTILILFLVFKKSGKSSNSNIKKMNTNVKLLTPEERSFYTKMTSITSCAGWDQGASDPGFTEEVCVQTKTCLFWGMKYNRSTDPTVSDEELVVDCTNKKAVFDYAFNVCKQDYGNSAFIRLTLTGLKEAVQCPPH